MIIDFVEIDVPYLLKKIPSEARETHYHSDGVHIKRMLTDAGLKPTCSLDVAAATVRGIMLTVSHRKEIGELYPQVLKTMVYGTCQKLFES